MCQALTPTLSGRFKFKAHKHHTSITDSPVNTLPTPNNSFDDDLVTNCTINNIQTTIVIDSGAKFQTASLTLINEPVKFVSILVFRK